MAAVANVSPASITNGVTAEVATGTSQDNLRADLSTLFDTFLANNLSVANAVFIMSETQAMAIGMMLNPLGQPTFPNINANGGTLLGIPVVTSESVRNDSNGGFIILAKPGEILLADDGGVTVDVSREASLQMNTAPDNPPSASTVFTSLWQTNNIGIRAERWINWAKRRSQAVAYISHAKYA